MQLVHLGILWLAVNWQGQLGLCNPISAFLGPCDTDVTFRDGGRRPGRFQGFSSGLRLVLGPPTPYLSLPPAAPC